MKSNYHIRSSSPFTLAGYNVLSEIDVFHAIDVY